MIRNRMRVLGVLCAISFVCISCSHSTFIGPAPYSQAVDARFRTPAPLTAEELRIAGIAWKYFENNTHEPSYLVNAAHNTPSTTTWDLASYLGGLVAAEQLELITKSEFDTRVTGLAASFRKQELFRNEMPNKAYNPKSGGKVDYAKKSELMGYSGLDIGRMLIWFHIVKNRYPEHSNAIDRIVLRWNFCNVIDSKGNIFNAVLRDNVIAYLQEGPLVQEEYSARGFQLWGFETNAVLSSERTAPVSSNGHVPLKDASEHGAYNDREAESYILNGIEFNGYTGHAPPFIDDGPPAPERLVVTPSWAIGLWALWDTPYTQRLFATASAAHETDKGFYEVFTADSKATANTFTANNNGIILTSLLYKAQGRLVKPSGRPSLWEKTLRDQAGDQSKCHPPPSAMLSDALKESHHATPRGVSHKVVRRTNR
ncbi:MAG: hypothetical protein ACI8W3_002885 [Myxococcota bacterium]|jgi:hypothetical protein